MRAVPCRIGGEWVEPGGAAIAVEDPSAPGVPIAVVPDLGPDDADAAIKLAHAAAPEWAAVPPVARADVLRRAADLMEARADEQVADLLAEGGKPRAEAVSEFAKSVTTLRYYAGLAGALDGRSFQAGRPGVRNETRREPIGPTVAITPWNVPMASPARKLAPALLAGNPVLIKPASLTPLSTYHLVAAIVDAGLPAGAIQSLTGPGSRLGQRLATHPDVAAVSFTGSTDVGLGIKAAMGRSLARLQLELGGKNGAVVLADADLDRAADVIVAAAFALAGQQCTATSRVIVERSVATELVDRIVTRTEALVIGPTADPATQIGPLIDAGQREITAGFVARAVAEGTTIATGGAAIDRAGYFYAPTVLTGVMPGMEVAREEVFGPVLAVIDVGSADEAIAVLNDTAYGLSAAVHSRDLAAAERFASGSDSGVVAVNGPTAGIELAAPFGGFKMSGTPSKEHGPESLDFYSRIKLVSWTY
jgi:acyl-CoA reductase-like NAD-dependent aldehyde dehydrogenase